MEEKNTDITQKTSEEVELKEEASNSVENSKIETTTEEKSTDIMDTNKDVEIIDEEDEEEVLPAPTIAQPNPKQKKIQIILGIISGAAIWFSLGLGYYMVELQGGNSLYSWLFVVIFAVIMFSRRIYENKKYVNTMVFSKYFLIGLIVFLGVYLLFSYQSGWLFQK